MPTLGAKDYSCAVSSHGQVFTDPWEKFFFLAASPLVTSACDRHRIIQKQARKKSLVPRISKLCKLQKQTISFDDQQVFRNFSFYIFSRRTIYFISTQADKIQFLSAKLTRASLFSFVSLFSRHVFSCRHCCDNNRVTSARWMWHQIRNGFGSHWACVLEPPSARRPSVLWEMQVRRTKVP